jgi:hypothetical protein
MLHVNFNARIQRYQIYTENDVPLRIKNGYLIFDVVGSDEKIQKLKNFVDSISDNHYTKDGQISDVFLNNLAGLDVGVEVTNDP